MRVVFTTCGFEELLSSRMRETNTVWGSVARRRGFEHLGNAAVRREEDEHVVD